MQEYYQELTTAAIVLAGTIAVLALVRFVLLPLFSQLARRRQATWDVHLVVAVLTPLMVLGLVLGLRMALLQFSSLEDRVADIVHWSRIVTTLIIIWALLRISGFISRQRVRHLFAVSMQSRVQYVNALRKIATIAIVAVGAVTVIGQMGYKITPLLTGLGIGGLAVALALQDTLANLFAGFYMMFDQPIRVGDYIQLKTGDEGFVQEIGWRTTRIRPWSNSEILVPNSVLSQSIFTNHYLPTQELSVVVECGVSYDSDLQQVQEVTKEVGRAVMEQVEGTVKGWEPVVVYHTFGESNVEFHAVLRAREFAAQYRLKSEFIKALHRRFGQEGIEISFPRRKVEVLPAPANWRNPAEPPSADGSAPPP